MTDNWGVMSDAVQDTDNSSAGGIQVSGSSVSSFAKATDDKSGLDVSLLAALAFFDVFDYPLTLAELRRFRYAAGPDGAGQPSLRDCLLALDRLPVGQREGYWFLNGRETTAEKRHERYRLADRKFRKARRLAAFIRRLPWVRLVAVCNSLAWSNAGPDSDIDLFIVCRPGTLWLARAILVGSLAFLGLRPVRGRSDADRFCLSFFLSEDSLDLRPFALPGGDPYLAFWLAGLVPLYDAGGVMERLWAANEWVRRLLPGSGPHRYGRRRAIGCSETARQRDSEIARIGDHRVSLSRYLVISLSRRLSSLVERLQRRCFPPEIAAAMNRDSRVVVRDDVLKFHVGDRREEFRRRWRDRLAALGIVI